MSLSRFFTAALVVVAISAAAFSETPAPTSPATPATNSATPTSTTPTSTTTTPAATTPAAASVTATPVTVSATTTTTTSLPAVVGLDDTDAAADAVSETFLTLTLAYLNQSYLGAGIFADTIASEAYEANESDELLGAQVALSQQVEQQMQALAKAPGHDRDDLEVIEGFIKVAQLNRIQWETLRDVLGGNEAKSKIWEEVRDSMFKELEKYAADEPAIQSATPTPPTTGPATGPATTTAPANEKPTTTRPPAGPVQEPAKK
ncbi:MAG: hypothetical protein K8U03_13035 [Planctomycetia bacterium]|nr:hypothetical protein [Planctomycetia bacterium]